ncbi:hypothetical protein Tco_0616921, partial [Tanacetum coccineum]
KTKGSDSIPDDRYAVSNGIGYAVSNRSGYTVSNGIGYAVSNRSGYTVSNGSGYAVFIS